jgi:hypothetical protein
MIILITGAPGCGKTAKALEIFLNSEQYKNKLSVCVGVKDYKGYPDYYEASMPEMAKLQQPNTVYLVDEGWMFYPSRVAGKPAPELMQHLPVHRHIGQDWIFTAQSPTQMDITIRRLVGRHIHLEKTSLGYKMYESGQCREDLKFLPEEKFNRPSLDNQVFDAYTSTDMRTVLQEKRLRIPAKLKWMLLLILFLGGFIYYMMNKGSLFHSGLKSNISASPNITVSANGQASSKNDNDDNLLTKSTFNELLPKDNMYPELSKSPRLPLSCISGHNSCVCYDQQNQKILDIPRMRCEAIVNGSNPLAIAYNHPLYQQNPIKQEVLVSRDNSALGQGGGVGKGEAAAPPSITPPDSLHVNGDIINSDFL